jgi:Flp pilus assembly protein TadB
MNIEALYISFSIFAAILLFIKGMKLINKHDIEMNKFKPNFNKDVRPKKEKKVRILSPSKTLMIILTGGFSTGILAYAIVGNIYISVFTSFAGLIFPKIWYKWYTKNQGNLISRQMEKAAEIMAAVLKTENNIVSALERAALDCSEPLKSKLSKASQEIRLGIPMTVTFESLAKSIDIPEMVCISVGIEMQQQGMAINMASMLEQVQKNIRNRQALKDELNVLTAENKMAGWIVAAIPFITLALIRQANPEFIAPLFSTPVGIGIFIVCTSLIIVGLYWLLQIAEMKDT